MPEKPFPNMVADLAVLADLAGNGCINVTSILPGWRRVFSLENTRESVHFFSAGKINVQGDALFFSWTKKCAGVRTLFFLKKKMCGGVHFFFSGKKNVQVCFFISFEK
jgi:hypothetical protein